MPQLCKYGYEAAGASHRGRVRVANEDSFGICAEDGLFVVCDGMGGAAAGEVASRVAVDAMLKNLCGPPKTVQPNETDPGPLKAGLELPELLREAVSTANHLVFSQAASDSRLHGMGTTLVALLTQDRKVYVAHVGDSRCYRLRGGKMEQLTRDHSLVDEQVKLGQLTREEAERSPLRNVITRAVGSQRSVNTEISEFDSLPGDVYLLCSDGLTRELPDTRIEGLIQGPATLDSLCEHLIDAANDSGGRDNITCVLVRAS